MDCCKTNKKTCKRKEDGRVFSLPRKFTRKRCLAGANGFTMRSSCAPYKYCKQQKGGGRQRCISVVNMNGITGVIKLKSGKNGCTVKYDINGLTDGKHGFHIHKCGDMTKGCETGCEHFNPFNKNHGGPHSQERHVGDLGNITSLNGISKGSITVKDISCDPKTKISIVGRMFVIHEDEDDLGKGGDEESLKTGNAGKRIACSIIGLVE
jgi:superoxide dismutase, Cu-Zn family